MKRYIVSICVLVFALALLMGGLLFVHRLETGQDNLEYILQACQLQHGLLADVLAWYRPPGYAAWIAVTLRASGILLPLGLFTVSPFALYLVSVLNVLLYALSAVIVFLWAEEITRSRQVSVAVGLLFATNQLLSAMSSVISAEPLLVLTVFLALWIWETRIHRGNGSAWTYAAFAICLFFAAEVKQQGLALVIAVLAWLPFRRPIDKKVVMLALVGVAVVLGNLAIQMINNPDWLIRLVSSKPHATGEVVSAVGRIERWFSLYPLAWADLVMPKIADEYGLLSRLHLWILFWPFVAVVCVLTLVGFVASARRCFRLSHLFFLLYGGMLVAWPDYLQRYLLPVAPLGFLFFVEGLSSLMSQMRCGSMLLRLVIGVMLFWSVATNAYAGVKNWTNIARLWGASPWAPERYVISREDDFADYIVAGQWVGANTPSNSMVFCRKALFIELAAGRRCEYYTLYATPEILWQQIATSAAARPTFILKDIFSQDSSYGKMRELMLTPALERHAQEIKVIHRTEGGSEILQVIPR